MNMSSPLPLSTPSPRRSLLRGTSLALRLASACTALIVAPLLSHAAATDELYLLGPDSAPRTNVPAGKIIGPLTLASQIFTNTTRHYWVYVPAQYNPAEKAYLMVFQDGHAFVSLTGDYRT